MLPLISLQTSFGEASKRSSVLVQGRPLVNRRVLVFVSGLVDLAAVSLEGIQNVLDALLVGFGQEVTADLSDDHAFADLWRGGQRDGGVVAISATVLPLDHLYRVGGTFQVLGGTRLAG